jgi:hypothetical protein
MLAVGLSKRLNDTALGDVPLPFSTLVVACANGVPYGHAPAVGWGDLAAAFVEKR